MQEVVEMLNNYIPLILGVLLLMVIFNTWYIACKMRRQTESAIKEFETQVNRRIALIGEMIMEIGKYVKSKKKNPFEEDFQNIVKKIGKVSISGVGQSVLKEADSVLQSAIKVAQKYPDLISSTKFKGLKKELEKVDSAIKSADSAYLKSVDAFNKWKDMIPFYSANKAMYIDKEELDGKNEEVETVKKKSSPKKKPVSKKKTVKKEEKSK